MAQAPKNDKSFDYEGKERNLILVSNNSDIFGQTNNNFFSRNSSRGPSDFRRNSSMSNLFTGFKQEQPYRQQPPKKQQQLSDAQRYAQQCLQYQKYQFDDKIRLIIHRMAILAYHSSRQKNQDSFLVFFIERFLCTLAKKLLMNRFQLLFLQYVFEQSKWRYNSELIVTCVNQFKSFMHIPQSQSPTGVIRNLQVYLLFCAYYSKKSLNDISQEGIYNFFLRTISEKFKERYQEWTQISAVNKIRINPKILNNIFKKLTSFQEKEKEFIENYNLLVQEILEISPAYNADKEGKVKRKKRKVQEEEPIKEPESNNVQQIQEIQDMPPEDSPPQFPLPFRKKQTSYVSNVDGLDPVYYTRHKS